MYVFLTRLGAWALTKVGLAVMIVALGLGAYAIWLFVEDNFATEARRVEEMNRLTQQRDRLLHLREELATQIETWKTEAEAQHERVRKAETILATLRDVLNWWDRVFGDRQQLTINEERARRMETLKSESAQRLEEARSAIVKSHQRLQHAELELATVDRELSAVLAADTGPVHYVRQAWYRSRHYLALALALYFFGPTIGKLLAYFGLAPLLARGRPIRFAPDQAALPAVTPSQVSLDVTLWPGEVLRVKEKFLQASDEGLSRRTRFVLDWSIPITSVACGLIELVEMRHVHADGERHVTFANSTDPHLEVALIELPEGGSLILRPSYIVGVITAGEEKVEIRRHWSFRWQAWVTLQFRFFEFVGPCRLIVAGSRGVRAERLVPREGLLRPARRTNQDATIGFTPNLDYLPVRAETFWSYYRGMNPLFDDLFAGEGVFVLQEISTGQGTEGRPARFWSRMWNGLLNVFGL